MSACIIPGPHVELRRVPDGNRWCFGCRKRLPHDLVVLDYPEPSYYEPIAELVCSRCHQDRTEFPQ